jgi:hypothetical protein
VIDRRTAKELLHVEGWLARAAEIVTRGKDAYLSDAMLQEAGDSLMMKSAKPPVGWTGWVSQLPTVCAGLMRSRTAP